jgi:hypothetical protein
LKNWATKKGSNSPNGLNKHKQNMKISNEMF